ncbi:MAG: asparagine synthase (glutamine-hydrolyzing) [Candidatus Rokuibacteriota bacterium]|nr:MAG: asparagine synthase (glutamine-hydrolyzing) [Candidatus Rokubacteria bacterium]PYN57535.1 MAG: asparagine synthase (glutamine-hydrolyzing) [Candidatus Rokubacteria bacterium]
MCGIAGHVGPTAPALLPAMLGLLKHRGPDDSGIHEGADVGLGMTRLAIIDLVTGQQPMGDVNGRYWIVFNGEIYNFRQLRAELEAAGRSFRTRSDTEVILQTYAAYGEACVERLRGMFAFAIWDGAERRLFLARDRLGKKPLYYWHRGRLLLFASEPKALLCHPAVSRSLDWAAFHHYLAFGYTPAAHSIFGEIRKLPPAHTATFADGRLALRRYWQLPLGVAPAVARTPLAEQLAAVREQVRESVRWRLESDVPLGVFLSGGVDSSAVVASMREVTSGRIATFSVGFGRATPSYDELPYARLVARRFETDHHEEILEPDLQALLPSIVRAFDEPFADSSAIPTYVVAQATASHVKVALSGIGGDETFGGYPRYLGVRVSALHARLPRWLRAASYAVARRFPDSASSRNLGDWARRFAALPDAAPGDRYIAWTRFFGDADIAGLARPALAAHLEAGVDRAQRDAFAAHGHDDPVDGAFRVDLSTYLPDDLLVMADRMSMASSLEVRAPFCDHRIVEQSLALAPTTKIPGFRLKGMLKAAYADVLPREVLAHRKQGFMIPLARWLRRDLRPTLDDLLAPDRVRARGLFEVHVVEALKREHHRGARGHADRLWTLMMAELWMREYLDHHGLWTLR